MCADGRSYIVAIHCEQPRHLSESGHHGPCVSCQPWSHEQPATEHRRSCVSDGIFRCAATLAADQHAPRTRSGRCPRPSGAPRSHGRPHRREWTVMSRRRAGHTDAWAGHTGPVGQHRGLPDALCTAGPTAAAAGQQLAVWRGGRSIMKSSGRKMGWIYGSEVLRGHRGLL